jgi:hypothetical protein
MAVENEPVAISQPPLYPKRLKPPDPYLTSYLQVREPQGCNERSWLHFFEGCSTWKVRSIVLKTVLHKSNSTGGAMPGKGTKPRRLAPAQQFQKTGLRRQASFSQRPLEKFRALRVP